MKRKKCDLVFATCLKGLRLVLIKLNVCTLKVLSNHVLEKSLWFNVGATVLFGKEVWQLSFFFFFFLCRVFKFENVTLLLWFLIMDHVSRKTSSECSKKEEEKKKIPGLSWKRQSMRKAAFLEMYNLWLKQEAPVDHRKGSFKPGCLTWLGALGSWALAWDAEK